LLSTTITQLGAKPQGNQSATPELESLEIPQEGNNTRGVDKLACHGKVFTCNSDTVGEEE
jgi:hypothetical protein